MPTVAETIRLHAGFFVPRDASTWRTMAASAVFLLAIMLVLPPLRTFDPPPEVLAQAVEQEKPA